MVFGLLILWVPLILSSWILYEISFKEGVWCEERNQTAEILLYPETSPSLTLPSMEIYLTCTSLPLNTTWHFAFLSSFHNTMSCIILMYQHTYSLYTHTCAHTHTNVFSWIPSHDVKEGCIPAPSVFSS